MRGAALIFLAFLISGALGAAVVNRITIDSFSEGSDLVLIVLNSSLTDGDTLSEQSFFTSPNGATDTQILGGERDLQYTAETGQVGRVFSTSVSVVNGTGQWEISTPNAASGVVLMQYDGIDGSINLNPAGFEQITGTDEGIDLTEGGLGNSFRTVITTDLDTTYFINVYSPNGDKCSNTADAAGGDIVVDSVLKFSKFTGSCDFTNVGAIEIQVEAFANVDTIITVFTTVGEASSTTPSATPSKSKKVASHSPSTSPTPSHTKKAAASHSPSTSPTPSHTKKAAASHSPSTSPTPSHTKKAAASHSPSTSPTPSHTKKAAASHSPSTSPTPSHTKKEAASHSPSTSHTRTPTASKKEAASHSPSTSHTRTPTPSKKEAASHSPSSSKKEAASHSPSSSKKVEASHSPSSSKKVEASHSPSSSKKVAASHSPSSSKPPSASRNPSSTPTPSEVPECFCECPAFTCELIFDVDDDDNHALYFVDDDGFGISHGYFGGYGYYYAGYGESNASNLAAPVVAVLAMLVAFF